jgi:hypothetical protein
VDRIDTSNLPIIVIYGSGFSSNNLDNLVELGGLVRCVVFNASSVEIRCRVDEGKEGLEAGNYAVSVSVTGVGLATVSAGATVIEFGQTAEGFWPMSSAAPGGGILSIYGSRFGVNTSVTLDGTGCEVRTVNYSLISCVIPANVSV